MRTPLLWFSFAFLSASVFAQSQVNRVSSKEIPLVAKTVQVIEQTEGLVADPMLDAKGSNPMNMTSKKNSGRGEMAVEREFKGNDTGLKLYRFEVEPNEKVEVSLESDHMDRLGMQWGLMKGDGYVPANSTKSQIDRQNHLPRPVRTKKLVFTNEESKVVPLLLVVYGEHGYSYRILVRR